MFIQSPKNRRRPWFKGRKSKVSIGECVEESVEVEPKTGKTIRDLVKTN